MLREGIFFIRWLLTFFYHLLTIVFVNLIVLLYFLVHKDGAECSCFLVTMKVDGEQKATLNESLYA